MPRSSWEVPLTSTIFVLPPEDGLSTRLDALKSAALMKKIWLRSIISASSSLPAVRKTRALRSPAYVLRHFNPTRAEATEGAARRRTAVIYSLWQERTDAPPSLLRFPLSKHGPSRTRLTSLSCDRPCTTWYAYAAVCYRSKLRGTLGHQNGGEIS